MKKRIYEIIEKSKGDDKYSSLFDYIIILFIFLSIISIILESYDNLSIMYRSQFILFEKISVIVFTIEYILRLWTSDLKYPSKNKLSSRIIYFFSFLALVDLFAILPFYLPMLIPYDLRFLRVLRLTRIFRIFKLNRYSKALNTIGKVIKSKKEELLSTVFLMTFIIIISSILIYYVENEVQPEAFPNIVASFWWSICTLTTVGYGDIYPITGLGKFFAAISAISGIGLVALPTGIISSGFMSTMEKKDKVICPRCGKEIEK